MLNQSDLGVAGGVVADDTGSVVGRSVVDYEGFPLCRELGECCDDFIEEPRDVGFLVVGGEEA